MLNVCTMTSNNAEEKQFPNRWRLIDSTKVGLYKEEHKTLVWFNFLASHVIECDKINLPLNTLYLSRMPLYHLGDPGSLDP
jgi:hypothetical protein